MRHMRHYFAIIPGGDEMRAMQDDMKVDVQINECAKSSVKDVRRNTVP